MPQDHTAAPGTSPTGTTSSVSAEEVAKFSTMAESWWDPDGDFAPLHRFNPIRLGVLRDWLCTALGRDPEALRPFDGLTLLDAGCGGGLIAEPMARLGFAVTAIDASERNIAVARIHAEQSGLAIDYRCTTPEDLAATGGHAFDVVLTLEVVEHVADVPLFLAACRALAKPDGAVVAATLNRTMKSLLLAKIGAEYILRWLPPGTHDWRKFLKPSELVGYLEGANLRVTDMTGLTYNPLTARWSTGRDMDVNYMVLAKPC